jgi:hypothetical protein
MSAEIRLFLTALAEADKASCPEEQAAEYAATLAQTLRRGHRRAVVVLLGQVRVRRVPDALAVIAVAAWPYLLTLLVLPFVPDSLRLGPKGHLFGVMQATICGVMLMCARLGWSTAENAVPTVAGLLASSPDRHRFADWFAQTLALPRQLAVAAVGVMFTLFPTYLAFGAQPLVYLPAAWTGFLGGTVLYWLFTNAQVPFRIQRCRTLRLSWIDPAHTPGIVTLCKTYAIVSAGVGAGVLLAEASAAAVSFAEEGSDQFFNLFVYGFPVLAAFTALYVGALPFFVLGRIVRSYQKETYRVLMRQIADPPEELTHRPELKDTLETYKHFTTLRTLPIRTWAIMQYAAGILASLIILFIQQHA